MKHYILIVFAAIPCLALSQRLSASLHLAATGYQGDLQSKRVTFTGSRPAAGLGLSYNLSAHFIACGVASYMTVTGDDKYNAAPDKVYSRNLDFASHIVEAQLALEYNFFDITERGVTPYLLAGIAAYHYNPYSYDLSGNKVFLRTLNTEGQGLSQYPDKKTESNKQIAIPFGGGVKFAFTPKIQVGIEICLRKLFTDYLDDVSGTYADSTILAAGRGPQAVAFAYREAEIHITSHYPAAGSIRGNPENKDLYYTTGINVRYLFGGSNERKIGGRNKTGCPVNVY